MAIWIQVCCRSDEPITYGELEEVMGRMGWLDRPAKFDPPLDETNGKDPNWDSFHVEYRPDKRPIVVQHHLTKAEMLPVLSDIREQLEDLDESEMKRELLKWLDATKQMVVFEIPDDLPQDVWEMCDAAAAFLARERDGVIISDEGVFDGEMNPLVKFGDN